MNSIAEIGPVSNGGSNHNGLPEWQRRLKQRGFLEEAIRAHWQERSIPVEPEARKIGGWQYPVYDPATEEVYINPVKGRSVPRWKNFDKEGQGGEKYRWLYGQQGAPPYYVLPGTKAAIKEAAGLAYIAAGEPDVLTYRSVGICNTFCWLNGESSVPSTLAEDVIRWGVIKLVYLVDNDEKGLASARLTAKCLEGTTIAFTAYKLPAYLGDKGDINDMWRWHDQNRVQFLAELNKIMTDEAAVIIDQPANTPVTIQSIEPRRVNGHKHSDNPTSQVDWVIERQQWIEEEIMPRLDQIAPVVERSGKAEYRHCPNPNHVDQHPSFRISYDRDSMSGIPQCSCDIQHQSCPWDRVAEWVGARSFKEWFKQERQQLYRQAPIQSACQPQIHLVTLDPLLRPSTMYSALRLCLKCSVNLYGQSSPECFSM